MAVSALMTQMLLPKIGGGRVPAAELLMVGYGARQHIRKDALQHLHQEITITRRQGSIALEESLARLVRGRVLEVRHEEFVQAAVAAGMRDARILARHVLPHATTTVVIETSLLAGQAVLLAAALGFLGLGIRPPAPEWGTMLSGGREFLEVAPHLVVAPGVAISLLVFAFNIFGDGLRDRLDPRHHGRGSA